MYEYRSVVLKVHDGDTITVDLDLGLNIHANPQKLRLIGINAPEMKVAPAGEDSRQHLIGLLGTRDQKLFGQDAVDPVTIYIATVKVAEHDLFDNYGRLLAWLYLDSAALESGDRHPTLNWKMWTDKFAVKFMAPSDWPVA